MTKEERELLLKDLCSRLPYGVMAKYGNRNTPIKCDLDCHPNIDDLENTKPYLRPMSSMTKEERAEYEDMCDSFRGEEFYELIDWANKNMFDYRGLIPMGLALPTTEGIYNIQ